MQVKKMAVTIIVILLLTGCGPVEPEYTFEQGKLIILQAYGNAGSGAPSGVSHSFVEIYNITNEAINLSGIKLYFANGTSVPAGQFNNATKDEPWQNIALNGIIPAKGSFLILGARHPETSAASTRLVFDDNYGDINDNRLSLSRRGFKAALVRGSVPSKIQNPFTSDDPNMNRNPVIGYIDMVGTANEYRNRDLIFGFEGAPARNSVSEAVRRIDLFDFDNNSTDFISARYASGGMTNAEVEARKPRNSKAGVWDPFEEPEKGPQPPPASDGLMILQANTYGNANGLDQSPPAPTGGGFARSLVELYNNSNSSIDLTAGNYYLHIGGGTAWIVVIKLEGIVPSKSSFLIVDNTPGTAGVNATPRAVLPAADQEAPFVFPNNSFKVALMRNQSSLLTVDNPSIVPDLYADYVDMLGVKVNSNAFTPSANGFETTPAWQSRPQPPRRTSLTDTNNNYVDFLQSDLRGHTGSRGVPNSELFKLWPRNAAMGAWNPITGEPAINPTIQ